MRHEKRSPAARTGAHRAGNVKPTGAVFDALPCTACRPSLIGIVELRNRFGLRAPKARHAIRQAHVIRGRAT